jgi:hypothetical protein
MSLSMFIIRYEKLKAKEKEIFDLYDPKRTKHRLAKDL